MAGLSLSPEDRVFLEAARVGRLATASAGGEPHVVPVCFVFDESPVIRLTPEQVASWAAVPPDPSA